MNYFQFPISFGSILVHWSSQGLLSQVEWSQHPFASCQNKVKLPQCLQSIVDQITVFFYRGQPIVQIPWSQIDQSGWSEFQKEVYLWTSRVPHGETRTYGWLAAQVGKKSAFRAVGQALRKNPLPILIPCHRILSVTSMGGFMGVIDPLQPELQLKWRLLQLEEEYRSPFFPFMASSILEMRQRQVDSV